jgi:GNAT superfamily N-acetyltransferase
VADRERARRSSHEVKTRTGSIRVHVLRAHELERFRAIRLRSLADAPEAFGTRLGDATTWPDETWAHLFESLVAFVVELDGADVGLARCAAEPGVPEAARLGSFWVAPEARGRGVGEALIDAVAQWAREAGFVELRVDVTDDNAAAIALYARMGFEPTGNVGTHPPPRSHVTKHTRALKL